MSGCGKNIDKKEDASTNSIVWALPQEYEESVSFQHNIHYLNEKLKSDGYDFSLKFNYIKGNSKEYYNSLLKLLKDGEVDIAYAGADDVEDINSYSYDLIKSGVFLPLNKYLKSEEGKLLYKEFYKGLWKTVQYKKDIYTIPNEVATDGECFVAFNKKYFGKNVSFDGSWEKLAEELKKSKAGKIKNSVLWDISFDDVSSSLGYYYGYGMYFDNATGEVSCPYESYKLKKCFEVLHTWNKEGILKELERDDNRDKELLKKDFAIWVSDDMNFYENNLKEDFILSQMPCWLNTRYSGSTGVCSNSKNAKQALQLLTILYTNGEYSNLLFYGKENETYQRKEDGIYDMENLQMSSFMESIVTGIYTNVYPTANDNYSVNRKKIKEMLYNASSMKESVLLGFYPEVKLVEKDISKVLLVSEKYQNIWQEEDLNRAFKKAIKECNDAGNRNIEKELNYQVKEWLK